MARPPKLIPDNIGRRIEELYNPPYVGSRRVSDIIADEYGPDFRYSHAHIMKYLNRGNQIPNVSVGSEPTPPAPAYFPPAPPARKRSIAAWQIPDVYVNSITPSRPSTLIVPPPDSMQQVMLDLIRAEGYAMINQQHQPQTQQNQPQPPPAIAPQPETPPDAKSHDEEDRRNKMKAEVDSIGRELEKQAQEKEEEELKRLKTLQEDFDQFWKRLESKQSDQETTKEKTGSTQLQKDSKNDPPGLPADNNMGVVVTQVTAPPTPSPPPVTGGEATYVSPAPASPPQYTGTQNQPPKSPPVAPDVIGQNPRQKPPTNPTGGYVMGQLPDGATQSPVIITKKTLPMYPGSGQDETSLKGSEISAPPFISPQQPRGVESGKSIGGVSANTGTDLWDYWWVPVLGAGGILLGWWAYRKVKGKQSAQAHQTQPSSTNADGYARVNEPNGTALF